MNTIKTVPEYSALICFALLHEAHNRDIHISDQHVIQDSSALLLAKQVIVWCMDMNQDLDHVREVMYLLHHVCISDEVQDLVED